MHQIEYTTEGTCSKHISVTIDENDIIRDVTFIGGCNGNLQGICRLVTGQKVQDIIRKLEGIRCGAKPTSCPDQLCQALKSRRQ